MTRLQALALGQAVAAGVLVLSTCLGATPWLLLPGTLLFLGALVTGART